LDIAILTICVLLKLLSALIDYSKTIIYTCTIDIFVVICLFLTKEKGDATYKICTFL
jgi:hypothetical protein